MAQAQAQSLNLRSSAADEVLARKPRSLWSNAWRQFKHHRLAMTSMFVLIGLIAGTVLGPVIYTKRIDGIDFGASALAPSLEHPFGTNDLGQDLLARALWGGRISISVGITSVFVSIILGTSIGAIAGYFGGTLDSSLM